MISFLLKLFTGNPLSMVWVIGGVALAAFVAGGSAAWTVQGWRLEACQAKVEAGKVLIQGLGNQIETQNQAVDTLEKAAKAAKAKGAAAIQSALKATLPLQNEIDRLSALLKQPRNDARTCQDGVAEARKGLVP